MKKKIKKRARSFFSKDSKLITWADQPGDRGSGAISMLRCFVRVLLITLTEFKKNELSLRSAALTYTIMLSLVPMLAMSTAVVKGLGGGDQLRTAAYTYIETLEGASTSVIKNSDTKNGGDVTPVIRGEENLTGHLSSAVDTLFDYVDRTNFATLGTFGVVGILLSVLLVLNHIESAMNAIWNVTAGRSLLRKLSDYITLLILLPFSINIAFAASAFLKNQALASKMDKLIPFEWLQTLLLKPLPILFITFTFYVMYIFFPNIRVKTTPAMLGSFLAALLWFGVQNVYIGLQIGVSKYNAIYGSFATLPLFLVWMYLGWIFILIGAQVAFACQNVQRFRLRVFTPSPSLKLGAAFDIMDIIQTSFRKNEITTPESLLVSLPDYGQGVIDSVSCELIVDGLIHVSKNDGRLLPAHISKEFDKEYDKRKLIDLILGDQAPDTPGGRESLSTLKAAGDNSPLHTP